MGFAWKVFRKSYGNRIWPRVEIMHHPTILECFDCREGDTELFANDKLFVQSKSETNDCQGNEDHLYTCIEDDLKGFGDEVQRFTLLFAWLVRFSADFFKWICIAMTFYLND